MAKTSAKTMKLVKENFELHAANAKSQQESRLLKEEILGVALKRQFELLPDLVDRYWELYDERQANYKAIENRSAKIKELQRA